MSIYLIFVKSKKNLMGGRALIQYPTNFMWNFRTLFRSRVVLENNVYLPHNLYRVKNNC